MILVYTSPRYAHVCITSQEKFNNQPVQPGDVIDDNDNPCGFPQQGFGK